jgi:hypothetical protein
MGTVVVVDLHLQFAIGGNGAALQRSPGSVVIKFLLESGAGVVHDGLLRNGGRGDEKKQNRQSGKD